jgi:hypothetical protein
MEYINRKIKIKQRDTSQHDLRIDWIDNMRLSLRFVDTEDKENEILINFTKDETAKIIYVLREKIEKEAENGKK